MLSLMSKVNSKKKHFIVPSNLTIYEIPFNFTKDKFGLISDFHLGHQFPINESMPLLIKQIQYLIDEENISSLIILGDSFDGLYSLQNVMFENLLKQLETLRKNIFLIGGNHDRITLLDHYNFHIKNHDQKYKYVNIITNDIIRLKHPIDTSKVFNKENEKDKENERKYENYFIAHDFLSNLKIRGSKIPSFFQLIRKKFNHTINKKDTLIIGHTHEQYQNRKKNDYSIGQFSIDYLIYEYAILDLSKNPPIKLKKKQYRS